MEESHGSVVRISNRMTQADMAAAILRAAEKPLHVKEIKAKIKKSFKRDLKEKTLTAILFQYAKRGKFFYKHEQKRNTYGLTEWLVSGKAQEGIVRTLQ